jgi:hypothetical protein
MARLLRALRRLIGPALRAAECAVAAICLLSLADLARRLAKEHKGLFMFAVGSFAFNSATLCLIPSYSGRDDQYAPQQRCPRPRGWSAENLIRSQPRGDHTLLDLLAVLFDFGF